jgi:hypothetical protein
MNIERIRKRITGGFKPFLLRTSDGREFEVPHPEFIMLGKYDIVVQDREGEIDIVDPLHVVSIKTLKSKNGAPARQ